MTVFHSSQKEYCRIIFVLSFNLPISRGNQTQISWYRFRYWFRFKFMVLVPVPVPDSSDGPVPVGNFYSGRFLVSVNHSE